MKELSIEQKAKAYDEALERAKSMIDNLRKGEDILAISDLESMFPELKVSEDERIKKELISFLQLPHPQFVGERKQEKWIAWLEKQGEQKADWSEEDEKIYQSIMDDTVQENQLCNEQIIWLKSLKNRGIPQPKQEWSEEDEETLEWLCRFLEKFGNEFYGGHEVNVISWLKSLRPQNTWKP